MSSAQPETPLRWSWATSRTTSARAASTSGCHAANPMREPRSSAVDLVVSRGTERAAAVLADVELPSAAYAVGLWGTDDEVLDPGWVCIGLEPDRVAALAGPHPTRQIWV